MAANLCTKEELHVLVIGAGATGVLIAHGLQKAGIKVSIFERAVSAQTFRPRDWTLALHWGLPLIKSLLPDDMAARLVKETYVDPNLDWDSSPCDRMRMYNGLTGAMMKEVTVEGQIGRISRKKLINFLALGIDIQWNRQLIDVQYESDGVTAVFASGDQVRGTILVGCDGPKSSVRTLLLGPEKGAAQPLRNVIHCNTSFCVGDAEKARFLRSAHPAWATAIHPDIFCLTSIVDAKYPDSPETWIFQVVAGWLGDETAFPDTKSKILEVKRRGALLCEPFRTAVQLIPDDYPVTFELLHYWISTLWETKNGRVTLAGDAAHPMPPHRGQGLNHAIMDAFNLVKIITESVVKDSASSETSSLAEQVDEYTAEVVARGSAEVKMSRDNAYMALDWEKLQQSSFMKHGLSHNDGKP